MIARNRRKKVNGIGRLAGRMPPKAAFPEETIGNIVDAESSYSKGKHGAVQWLCRRDA
jgi:hypothetical protein